MSRCGCGPSARRRPRSAETTSAGTRVSSTSAATRLPWMAPLCGCATTRSGWGPGRRMLPKGRGRWASASTPRTLG
eukprot:10346589-Alexandrium_andersonii.AAC.1